jgi:hypothetical protein
LATASDESREAAFGRRLSVDEYQKAIVALHATLPPMPTREQDRAARRAALDLAVDHRLGVDFPKERRDELFVVQQRVERRRLWFALKHGVARLFGGAGSQVGRGLSGFVVGEYAKVLSKAELDAYFGRD